MLGLVWIGVYLTGLVAAIVVFNHAHKHHYNPVAGLNTAALPGSLPQEAIAQAGPCQVSIKRCLLGSLVMADNEAAEQIIVVVKVHNASQFRAVHYSSWRNHGSKAGFNPTRAQNRSWFSEFKAAFHGPPAGGAVSKIVMANDMSMPGFAWRNCMLPPGGTVYDILRFTLYKPQSGTIALLLKKRNLGQRGEITFRIQPEADVGFSPYRYAMRNRPIVGGGGMIHIAGVLPHIPAVATRVKILNLNRTGQSVGVTVNVPAKNGPHVPNTVANSAAVFNNAHIAGAGKQSRLPTSSVAFWHGHADPPLKPLKINLHGHAVIPFSLQAVTACPQGEYLCGQTWFEGKFVHFYTINLRTGGSRLAISMPAGTVRQARISPDGRYIAIVDSPYTAIARGPNLPGSGKEVLALWSCTTGRELWHESFARLCPYSLIGFATGDSPLIKRNVMPRGARFYTLNAKSGQVQRTWFSKFVDLGTPLQISPGGKYLAAYSRGILFLWNNANGKLVGESNVAVPGQFASQSHPSRLAFSPGGNGIAVSIAGAGFPWQTDYLLKWNANNGKLIAQAIYHPAVTEFAIVPAAQSFGCISGNGGWQIGLGLIDAASGRLYHRFSNPARGDLSVDPRDMLAWTPDPTHLVCSASSGSHWGYTVLHADADTLAAELAAVYKGERHNDWKLGSLKKANTRKCDDIALPTAAPAHWSFTVKEPRVSTTTVPVRIIPTRLLTTQQGGPGHSLEFDSVHFAGAQNRIALVAYRQLSVGETRRPTAFWIDRVDLRSGAILGSFESPTPGAKLLDLGAAGKTMLLATRDTVDVYRWGDRGTAARVVGWHVGLKPSGNLPVNIIYGRLLTANQALTMTAQGTVVIWSIPDCRAECTFQANSISAPALDAARKLMAFSAPGGIYLINIHSGELIGPISGPPTISGPLAFSPDGRHLAMLVGGTQLAMWNLHRGKYLGRFSPPAQPLVKPGATASEIWRGLPLQWLNNRFLEINGDVFDWPEHRAIWRLQTPFAYFSATAVKRSFDQRCWTLQLSGNRWQMVGVRLPTPRMLKLATAGGAKMLLKPGDKITVHVVRGNFLGISGKYKQAAIRQLQREGFRVVPGQAVVMTISCNESKPISEQFGYGLFGNIHPFMLTAVGKVIRWRVSKGAVTLWSQRAQIGPTIPPVVTAQQNKNPQEYVNQSNDRLFLTNIMRPNMPDHILARTLSAADVSVIGRQGIVSENRSRFVAVPGLRRAQ